MNELENKIVIVTGAARGVGRGIASEMLRAGATVILVDMSGETLEDTTKFFSSQKLNVYSYICDITHQEENNKLVDWVLSKFGRIDVLVNNAGIAEKNNFLDVTFDEVMSVHMTNFIGPFFLTQRVVKTMIEGNIEGSILFTSSTHSRIIFTKSAYSSSKAALEMFIKECGLELSKHGIRVNGVAPGAIDTWGMDDRKSEMVPLGYLGAPEDVGKAMTFLASDNASYITGEILVVDGAFSLAHTHYWKAKNKI
ncbi:MAG: SDR family oxidoreductase [bacterium]|nr:SDR family oxidoreductase [bacterium]